MRKRGRERARRTERRGGGGGGGKEGSAQPAAARVPVAWCRSLSLVLRASECVSLFVRALPFRLSVMCAIERNMNRLFMWYCGYVACGVINEEIRIKCRGM